MNWKYKAVMFLTLLVFCVGSVCATDVDDNATVNPVEEPAAVVVNDPVAEPVEEVVTDVEPVEEPAAEPAAAKPVAAVESVSVNNADNSNNTPEVVYGRTLDGEVAYTVENGVKYIYIKDDNAPMGVVKMTVEEYEERGCEELLAISTLGGSALAISAAATAGGPVAAVIVAGGIICVGICVWVAHSIYKSCTMEKQAAQPA